VRKAYRKLKATELSALSASVTKTTLTDVDPSSITIVRTEAGETAGHKSDVGEGNDSRNERIETVVAGAEHENGEDEQEVKEDGDAVSEQGRKRSSLEIHPQRQAMFENDSGSNDTSHGGEMNDAVRKTMNRGGDQPSKDSQNPRQRDGELPNRRKQKPGYFDKALTIAERNKAEAAERAAERDRRDAERQRKNEERERFRRAVAKARKPGRDGQRRLGRESGLLLEKVKKLVG
jgi:hypothetical protein